MFGLYPPEMQFNISINIERLSYTRGSGDEIWDRVSTVSVGPYRRRAISSEFQVRMYAYSKLLYANKTYS